MCFCISSPCISNRIIVVTRCMSTDNLCGWYRRSWRRVQTLREFGMLWAESARVKDTVSIFHFQVLLHRTPLLSKKSRQLPNYRYINFGAQLNRAFMLYLRHNILAHNIEKLLVNRVNASIIYQKYNYYYCCSPHKFWRPT